MTAGQAIQDRHRETTGERVIFVVEDDWRTRHFICTVLKYSTNALVFASSSPHHALAFALELDCHIDLLISNIELADSKNGMDAAREIAVNNPSMRVLLISSRQTPPADMPPAWSFLSIPFPTGAFLNCVRQLCGERPR